jgi:hypothetical protein
VKKNNLTRSAFAVLLLSSTVVSADQQYPAADFKPEVIYQNNDLIAKGNSAKSAPAAKVASAHDAQYPAADFKPEVIYQNNDLIAKGGSAAPAKSAPAAKAANEESAHDAQYPAANFKPEVLYVDPNYKPSQISPKASTFKEKASSSSVEAVSESVVEATPAAEKESSTLVYLFGLIALGLAGFYLFKKPTLKPVEKPDAPVIVQKSYALNTGVAKYINKITGTGVSRYIDSNIKAASAVKATGVAKYLAKKSVEPTAVKTATGVDKYVRNRG